MGETIESVRHTSCDELRALSADIYRLTMLSVDDWTEGDRLLAQVTLCHVSSVLALDNARPATGEREGE